jgi:hypothetical protein
VLGDTYRGHVCPFLSSRGRQHAAVRGGAGVQRNKVKAGSRLRREFPFFAGLDNSLQQGCDTINEMKKGMTRRVRSGS